MTGPIKKARKQQELDELVFNVLSSFRHQGAMQWTDWHETTSARRGKVGLGTGTFSNVVKRLMAQGRVQIDGDAKDPTDANAADHGTTVAAAAG